MKHSKSLFILTICVVMAAAAFQGCGKTTGVAAGGGNVTITTGTPPTGAGANVSIKGADRP